MAERSCVSEGTTNLKLTAPKGPYLATIKEPVLSMASDYPNLPYGVPYQDASEGPPTQQGVHDGSPMGDASIYQTSGSTSSDSSTIDSGSQPRKCSVRGCMTVIPTDTSNKMCEACRGRHRVYAMTKRAKRKLEKDSLVQQSVALLSSEQPAGTVWLPENPQLDEEQREPWIQRPDASVEVCCLV